MWNIRGHKAGAAIIVIITISAVVRIKNSAVDVYPTRKITCRCNKTYISTGTVAIVNIAAFIRRTIILGVI